MYGRSWSAQRSQRSVCRVLPAVASAAKYSNNSLPIRVVFYKKAMRKRCVPLKCFVEKAHLLYGLNK
jgi:hypothetical protein